MTFGSLFAGIGGLDLGLERAGMKCVWQVETDPYCRKVLEKHWPDVRRHDDVKTFPPVHDWNAFCSWPYADLICGGFPCQDISNAGRRAGIEGARSGLWSEFARIVNVVRPDYVLVENVAALLARGMDRVLGDLSQLGYSAEWDCLPAAAFGALHIRNRVFLLAYSERITQRKQANQTYAKPACRQARNEPSNDGSHVSNANGREQGRREQPERKANQRDADASGDGPQGNAGNPFSGRHGTPEETIFAGRGGLEPSDWWITEPDVGRVANGVPSRVDRLKGLGNAVVPQVAEWIGRRIMEAS